MVAHQAHILIVGGSNPPLATLGWCSVMISIAHCRCAGQGLNPSLTAVYRTRIGLRGMIVAHV